MTAFNGTLDRGAQGLDPDRARVLKNTYWLLALTMLPTIAGAWLGSTFSIFAGPTGGWVLLGVVVATFGMIFGISKAKDSALAVPLLLGFTFLMGLVLSGSIDRALKFKNGAELVMTAFGGTAGVFFAMASLATVIKRDISGMGKWLFAGLIALIVVSVINIFVGSSVLMLTISAISVLLFSAYLLYDIKQVIDGGETNYVMATMSIYLDLINIFQGLLNILGIFGGESD